MKITLKQLRPDDIDDFIHLVRLFERVFEMQDFTMPPEPYLQNLLTREGFIVYVATHQNQVVGGLTAHVLPSYYFESSEVYLYDLAVETKFQRKGIGKKLLSALSDHCEKNNYREFFVQADVVDAHAIEFYHATGGIAERVVHFNYPQTEG